MRKITSLLVFFTYILSTIKCIQKYQENNKSEKFKYYSVDKNFNFHHNTTDTEIKNIETIFQNKKFQNQHQDTLTLCKFQTVVNQTGWYFLDIITNENYSDDQQGYAAGLCEGQSSYFAINQAYNNYVNSSVLNGNPDFPENAQRFVNDQYNWMKTQSETQNSDFWKLIHATLQQLQGMYDGYAKETVQNGETPIDFIHFYHLSYMGDTDDVLQAFKGQDKDQHSCNVIIKLTNDNDLLVGQSTFNIYQLMLRIYKTYILNYNNKLVVNKYIQFSSRPGDLNSKDDFYTFSNFSVVETSLLNWNHTNYQYLHYDSLPCWIRVITANKITDSVQAWSQYFKMYRSGTHNNQWFVIDYNNNDILMVEESYYNYKTKNMNQILKGNSYIAGYNVPYHKEIFQQNEYNQGYEGFTYNDDPRAELFRTFEKTITNTASLQKLMYLNQNITGNVCGVPPTHAITNEIAPRCDLLPPGQQYTFGLIDAKIVNREMLKNEQVLLKSGPSTSGLPPFNWNDWPELLHEGFPEIFNFDWLLKEKTNNIQNQKFIE